jgi:N utilization substance protein A
MNEKAVLSIVDQIQREQNISRETIFSGIERAVLLAAQKHFGETSIVVVSLDRNSGKMEVKVNDDLIEPDVLGRIASQAAKQLMIQIFREAASQAVFDEFAAKKGDLVKGTIQRFENGTATVTLGNGKTEAILPRSEQIPGEQHHVGDRIDAVILDVKRTGHRVKIILSRNHPDFVRQLFEKEIPEIADRTIEIKAVAREAGYRTKVAVSSIDMKVDCVGACVGVRGSRIKNVVDALGGERIDIVRWNDALQVLIPNALQPATIEEVFLYPRLGRAIVLVQEDQLSLAIGRRGQNVRLASKLVGWDIEIMTLEELNQSLERAEGWFSQLPYFTPEAIEAFIEEGFLSYDDLTCVEASEIAEIAGITEEQGQEIYDRAEELAEEVGEETRPRASETADSRSVSRSPAASKVASLFGDSPASEARQTFANLFPEDRPTGAPEEGMVAEGAGPPPEASAGEGAVPQDGTSGSEDGVPSEQLTQTEVPPAVGDGTTEQPEPESPSPVSQESAS